MEHLPSFAVMGTGGIGGCFGGALAHVGYPVTFIARGLHLAAIRERGLRIDSDDGSFTVKSPATDDASEIGPVDYVLFGVKLWDTEEAAHQCKPLIGAETAVVSLQNGVEATAVLSKVLGEQHVIGGIAEISAGIEEPGVVRRMGPHQVIRFGELDNQVTGRVKQLDVALRKAGLGSEIVSDTAVTIWTKYTHLTGLSALTALTRKTVGEVREDEDTRRLLVQIMSEVAAVARANGVPLPKNIVENRMALLESIAAPVRASMANDLAAGRRLELPWLSGGVARIGRELDVPTPANQFIYTALKLHMNGGQPSN